MKKYQIVIGSPVDYEEITADIVIDNIYVARLSKDEGLSKMKLCFFSNPVNSEIYLNDFLRAIEDAKILLIK